MLSFYTKSSKLRLPLSHHNHSVAKVMNQRKILFFLNRENKDSKTLSAQKKKVLIAFVLKFSKCGIDTSCSLLITKQQQPCLVSASPSSLSAVGTEKSQFLIFKSFVNISEQRHKKSHSLLLCAAGCFAIDSL